MNDRQKPSYEELEQRLKAAESALQAIREGQVNTIIGEHETLVVRLGETERALKESEEKFRNLFRHHAAVKLIIDPDTGDIVDVNDAAERFYGWSVATLKTMQVQDINTLSPDQVKAEMEKARSLKRVHFEFRHRLADGTIRDVDVYSSRIDISGKPFLHSVIYDATDRKIAEQALRESEKKLKTILDSLPDMVLEVDSKMMIQWANKRALDLNPDAVGQTCYKAFPGNEEMCEGCVCHRAFESGKIETGIMYQPASKTAGESYWENIGVPLKDLEGKTFRVLEVSRNVTERELSREKEKRFQDLLVHTHKMEAIATLTGGIAHDYNNLLSIIMGNLSLAMYEAEPGSDLADLLVEAEKASRKAGNLTHELMSLSKGGAPVKDLGPLQHLLHSAADVVPKDSGISITESIQADLWPVPHDARKMDAVFRNVVANAVEAMPDGGILTIGAENLELGEKAPHLVPGLRPGAHVKIFIADQGRGIPGEHMDKLFDPYFSTKPMGVQKGMGLGLATAYAIVQKHGGHITVDSTPGVGTNVLIYLPAEGAKSKAHGAEYDGIETQPTIDNQQSTIKSPFEIA